MLTNRDFEYIFVRRRHQPRAACEDLFRHGSPSLKPEDRASGSFVHIYFENEDAGQPCRGKLGRDAPKCGPRGRGEANLTTSRTAWTGRCPDDAWKRRAYCRTAATNSRVLWSDA